MVIICQYFFIIQVQLKVHFFQFSIYSLYNKKRKPYTIFDK